MFKFLKDKLKSAISRISDSIKTQGQAQQETKITPTIVSKSIAQENLYEKKEEVIEKKAIKEQAKELKSTFTNDTNRKLKQDQKSKQIQETIEEHQKKTADFGFLQAIKEKITTTKISSEQFDGMFWELELALMENNVAIEVISKIKNDLKAQIVEKPIKRTKVGEAIESALKSSIMDLLKDSGFDLLSQIKEKKEKPYVIAFFGINGSGKTTSIAKLANMLKENNVSCVLAACDTFRAASIEQLEIHADKIGVRLIKHDYGSDPAAIAFDAIKHAKARGIDAVLIDTAGRMHSNSNLIEEMKKIIRVSKPDLKIFVGESITGNDCIEQAKTFDSAVGIDGIILAKADVDEKGGAALSVSYVTKKPILFLGIGQDYKDIEPFSKDKIMKGIGLA